MRTVNIHAAKTHQSRLLEDVAGDEEIVIAKAGKPVARLVAVEPLPPRRLGLMEGQFTVPDDFDTTFNDEIWATTRRPAIAPSTECASLTPMSCYGRSETPRS